MRCIVAAAVLSLALFACDDPKPKQPTGKTDRTSESTTTSPTAPSGKARKSKLDSTGEEPRGPIEAEKRPESGRDKSPELH